MIRLPQPRAGHEAPREKTRHPRVVAISSQVPIEKFLFDMGYLRSADSRVQQFRCDLHGDSQDNKPSARVYPEEGHAYCYACSKSRDVVRWAMDKLDLPFRQACEYLERKYGLPEWVDTFRGGSEEPVREKVPDPDFLRVLNLLDAAYDVPLQERTALYEAVDMVEYMYHRGDKTSEEAESDLGKILSKLTKLFH